jgi:hypothetical protein
MKLSTRLETLKRQKQARQPKQPKLKLIRREHRKLSPRHWAGIAIGLLLAGAAAWAGCELFLWNKLPPELVGKWEVQEGPMRGGSFLFSRDGTLEIRGEERGNTYTLKGKVAVEDKTLLTTTRNPRTRLDETRKSLIQELTASSMILELESGEVVKLARKK